MGSTTKIEWTDAKRPESTIYQHRRVVWSQKVWYGNQRDLLAEKQARKRGRQFEILALENLFPKLGLDAVIDLTLLMSSAPFDFMGSLVGERVLVDVSTKWQKRVDKKVALANALGFQLYVLLISPRDPQSFYFSPVRPSAKTIRVPFELLRCMGIKAREIYPYGR